MDRVIDFIFNYEFGFWFFFGYFVSNIFTRARRYL